MWARVTQVGDVAGLAFVLVEFRSGRTDERPRLINDFLFNWPSESVEVIVDDLGRHQLTSGEWVLPVVEVDGEWQPRQADYAVRRVTFDVPGRFRALVEQFADDHPGRTGDMTDADLTVTASARGDVLALLGAEWKL